MSGMFLLQGEVETFDNEEDDIAFIEHDSGYIVVRISEWQRAADKPVYGGWGATMDDASDDFNDGLLRAARSKPH